MAGAYVRGAVAQRAWWDVLFLDRSAFRRGGSTLFFLLHPDGYASYRIRRDGDTTRCSVVDLFAATDGAHAALWRVLLGLDLVDVVSTTQCPPGDPLPFLLADPRQVRTVAAPDGLWVRLLDVPAALSARRYGVELDVVLEVDDPFLGRGGRFRLRGGPDGTCCAPTDRQPQARTDLATLGAVYLGGHRPSTAARAGLLRLDDPALALRMDAAFLAERAPQHGTAF